MNLIVIWGLLMVVECNNQWYYTNNLKDFRIEQPFLRIILPQVFKIVQPIEFSSNKLEVAAEPVIFNNEEIKENISTNQKTTSEEMKNNEIVNSRNKREAHSSSTVSAKPININKEAVEFIDISKQLPEIDELGALNKLLEANTPKPEMQHRTDTSDFSNKAFQEKSGITKEQWIKQPYPVHSVKVDDGYQDSAVLSSSSRAPSVRFVTQTRLDPEAAHATRVYEREARARDLPQSISPKHFSLPRESLENIRPRSAERYDSNFENRDYLYPPYFRNPYQGDNPYYRYQESFYEPRYRPSYDRERPEYTNRQRRIIYYATLPEVVRIPPNVNLRERYNFRDAYDNRYAPVRHDGFYSADRSSPYTSVERIKLPYSTKVLTDVNVQPTKKNPEKRTYSEPDRTRYVYDTYAEKGFRDLV